jgi:hypothetical protein
MLDNSSKHPLSVSRSIHPPASSTDNNGRPSSRKPKGWGILSIRLPSMDMDFGAPHCLNGGNGMIPSEGSPQNH